MNRRVVYPAIPAALWVGLLVFSLVYYAAQPRGMVRRVFWFPDATATSFQAEWRRLPERDTPHEAVHLYLAELFLGPARLGSESFVPPGTALRSVVLDDQGHLFVDIVGGALLDPENTGRSLEEVVEIMQRNVLHNFRFVRSVRVTVEGQAPGAPFFDVRAFSAALFPVSLAVLR